jgi:hypothetical protein
MGGDQSWFLKDGTTSDNAMGVSGGNIALGEPASGVGNQLLLTRTGAASLTHLPSSAGAGGLYVCADSAGALYRKSACP